MVSQPPYFFLGHILHASSLTTSDAADPSIYDEPQPPPSVYDEPHPTPPPSFYPTFAVSNIKNVIPLILDQEDNHYATWVEFFRIHVCAYNVRDHSNAPAPRHSTIDEPTWLRLDAIVDQWIYGTISKDLSQIIMKSDATAHELWPGLEEIFYDNKHTLAVYLEEQFNNTRLDQFSNISEYCQQLKLLANQLANVDNSISKNKMVLQLVDGLPKGEYDSLATMIQQANPLPTFNHARSQLLLEETRRTKQEEHIDTTLVTASSTTTAPPGQPPATHPRGGGNH
ncbi:uncharacterized protein LOC104886736 [Beta vulgaris subsp. vulgaris]|uniref:uncharacterized protein LOC104886736 n=1 Tax=Beta vulgaris subsp. vulgaris TaxID=3555 RepID=UPI000540242D|nr:uncharacterized protein LOC104886736 [Beta vulgaris subsp. vulgaris]